MRCPYCDQEHPDETKFCPETGRRIRKFETGALTQKEAVSQAKRGSSILSSPVMLIILGAVVLVILMTVILTRLDHQPALPVPTPDIPGTLAAIVHLTAAAQATQPLPATPTATQTMIPPTLTFTAAPVTEYIPPTRTPMAGAYIACPNAYPSVLHKGDVAMVSTDPPVENNLRDKPGTDSAITGALEPGEEVNIVGGPTCMGAYVWWSVVSRSSGRAGWTAEGDWNNYWLVKLD